MGGIQHHTNGKYYMKRKTNCNHFVRAAVAKITPKILTGDQMDSSQRYK